MWLSVRYWGGDDMIPKYDISSESYNLCEVYGYSWCECSFLNEVDRSENKSIKGGAKTMNFQKRMESFIAEMRIEGLTVEQIKELFEDSLDNVLSDEKDGEMLGKYGG